MSKSSITFSTKNHSHDAQPIVTSELEAHVKGIQSMSETQEWKDFITKANSKPKTRAEREFEARLGGGQITAD